jgi:pimeloyl-ACP methyl ester carboxylesterase
MESTRPTFALIPGAGGDAWFWHRLEPELQSRGLDAVPVALPAADDAAGLTEYADAVVEAVADRSPLVLVAQSLGGFTAPLVCDRLDVALLVLLNAMIPAPGETAGAWWEATGWEGAHAEQADRDGRPVVEDDVVGDFFHDVPLDVVAEAFERGAPEQTMRVFSDPPPVTTWPRVPTRVVAGRDDRFFPADFQRRIAVERLGITPDELPGGHLLALSRPVELADLLAGYWAEVDGVRAGRPRSRNMPA